MSKITPVVIAIIHHKGKFLLTERKNDDEEDIEFGKEPLWHFPGGALEFGEELSQALVREIKEETSLSIRIVRQLPHIYSAIRRYWHGLLIPHLCTIEGNDTVTLDHESIGYGWYTLQEIKKLRKLPFVQEMAEDAFRLL